MESRAVRLRDLQAQMEQTQAALAMAEAKLKEQREVIYDLLLEVGRRTSCSKCEVPVFWVHRRGTGPGMMVNPDGTQHWPVCKGLPAEQETTA